MSTVTGLDHQREFAAAWADGRNIRFELPPADINELLAGRYATGSPLAFTRDMLWEVEVRKAWQPDRYIPGVVRAGSTRAWGRRHEADGTETFTRSSRQRLWLHPGEYGLVLEQTHLDHQAQKVTFIGTAARRSAAGPVPRRALSRWRARPAGQPVAHRPPDPTAGSGAQPVVHPARGQP